MFNIVKVGKELRGSNFVSWYREDNTDYIINGYFAIKTNLRKEENRKLLGVLVEIFGAIPETNKCLEIKKSFEETTVTGKSKPDWMKAITERKTEVIEDTKLIEVENKGKTRIFKGEDYIYINMKYFEMVKEDSFIRYEGGKNYEPISIIDEDNLLLILPIRVWKDNEYLSKEKDLSAATE